MLPTGLGTLAVHKLLLTFFIIIAVVLTVMSLLVGGYDISITGIFTDPEQQEMFFISRVPRTLALIFAGIAMSVSGLIMQMITQNKFVEPTTIGTSQWAGLGILFMLIVFPEAPLIVRMVAACIFAFVGTMVFLGVLRRVRARSSLIVPLVGIMLGAVVSAITTFIAATTDLLQSMTAWSSGGFSSVVRGVYEPLWVVSVITICAIIAADRFTTVGLGKEISTNLGLSYERVVFLGTTIVAVATGVTSVVVGFLPFLGLVVPNIVSMIRGDNTRVNIVWVSAIGASLILACDLLGRVIVAPMEIPVSVVLGVVGAIGFIALIVMRRSATRVW